VEQESLDWSYSEGMMVINATVPWINAENENGERASGK